MNQNRMFIKKRHVRMCVSEFMPNVGDVYGWDVKFDTRLEINDYDSVFDICQQQF